MTYDTSLTMDQPTTEPRLEPESQSSQAPLDNTTLLRSLKFGIELETIITGVMATKEISGQTYYDYHLDETLWKDSAENLARSLRDAGIDCHVSLAGNKLYENYLEWCIIEESSIKDYTDQNRYGIELVSPVLTYHDRRNWTSQLEQVFAQLRAHDASPSHPSCSTHIHISTSPAWTLGSLKSLASAILYFDAPLSRLARRVRRESTFWARRNRSSSSLRGKSTAEALRLVAAAPAAFDLLCAMSPPGPCCREFRWNMWHVTGLTRYGVPPDGIDGALRRRIQPGVTADTPSADDARKTGTVEFRLPPGAPTAEEAAMWVDFVALFVLAAVGRREP